MVTIAGKTVRANDYNAKIIEEFRANEGRVGGPWAGAAHNLRKLHRHRTEG